MFLSIDNNEEIFGFIFALCKISGSKQEIYINEMAVRPDKQGQGIGKQLLNKVIEYSNNNGLAGVVLYTSENAPAAGFRKTFHKLCDYVNMLEQGHYEKRIELEGLAEFKDLEQGMNHLAGELEKEKAFRKQIENNRNQLIRNISHDLKNSLMGISGYAELCLGKQQLTSSQMKEYLELILQNSKRSNELLMSLFD